MKRTFKIGKIDYLGNGKRSNLVTITVSLDETSQGYRFSASADVWNHIQTDVYMGGQCLDKLKRFPKIRRNALFNEVYRLWKKYHLNDMHAGTPEQEVAVSEYFKKTRRYYDYTEACNHLKEIGLYEVEHEGKPYKYGHAWLYWPIEKEDLESMKSIVLDGHLK